MERLDRNGLFVEKEKIQEYLLCATHPSGMSKAAFFTRFGFSTRNWEVLAAALRDQGSLHAIESRLTSEFGMKYVVAGRIVAPDGRNPMIKTVWLRTVENSRSFRLITAYPVWEKKR